MFRGNMLTMREISELTGLGRKLLEKRVQKGIPLELPKMGRTPLYIPFRGKMLRPGEIAPIIGVSRQAITRRHQRGEVVDCPPHPGEEHVPRGHSRTRDFAGSVFNNARPYIFDERARHAMRYFRSCQPVTTDAELRAEAARWLEEECGMPPGTRISDEGVAWLREELRQELFVHRNSGGETLEMLGDVEGVCRERIRQLEIDAMRSFRLNALRLGMASEIVGELRDRATMSRESWAEKMDKQAPGFFDSAPRGNAGSGGRAA
jgi:hypothetical protein